MKKLKLFLFPLAMLLAAGMILLSVESNAKPTRSTDLYWFNDLGYTGRHQSEELEIPDSECPDEGGVVCETGYGPEDFVEYDNPWSELSGSAEGNEFIMKTTR